MQQLKSNTATCIFCQKDIPVADACVGPSCANCFGQDETVVKKKASPEVRVSVDANSIRASVRIGPLTLGGVYHG